MKFSLRQLEVLVAIGRESSVSRAAEALSMTQSATSMALAELERQFNTRLFDRQGKRLQLNTEGRELLPRAMELLDRAQELEALLEGKIGTGSLRIGATLTIGNYLATLLIGDYMQQNPGSRVELAVQNTSTIIDQVAHFKLDLGLIEGDSYHPDLQITPWVDDELVIFAAPDHPLASKSGVKLQDLINENWILRERGSGTRQVFDAAMRHQLTNLKVLLELEHTEAIKRAVESGLGIGCISRLALKDAFRRGSLVPLEIAGLDLKRQFNFVLHKQKFLTAGISSFLQLCREVTENVSRSDLIILRKPDGKPVEYR
ncbi:transcriptional regulator [Cellvibrio zantedeschiae]|uniref:Transcriptional regulator n=1 Tax=Cellvibrio zantedeschiae TaxID=1237077 RepID=A0ABQ3B087_9GAMM|nr:LysR family transcriptional regulator [Cellvibrio zantedeschiae]GGY69919.1 transcriptional regulator [Cellvibrio zantedeschiae]